MSDRKTARSSRTKTSGSQRKSSRRARASGTKRRRLELIGIDLAERRPKLGLRLMLPLLATALGIALAFSALRVDLIRMRYALADALAHEQLLVEEQRALTVTMRQLRDPIGLAARARELGFGRPERVIDIHRAPTVVPAQDDAPLFRSEGTALASVGATQP
jgi:hypothetical protein